jgi:hypothetical protein
MRKIWTWRLKISLALIAASAFVYGIHYAIYRDARHIFIYLIGDIAFLFINVLVVTLVIEQLLAQREKRVLMNKMNMVIGTFFSDVGIELLRTFSVFVENASDLRSQADFSVQWTRRDFDRAMRTAAELDYRIHTSSETLADLHRLLLAHRPFLLRLLENPNLLEHDRFTDVLWAVFHLSEELEMRGEDFADLPESDTKHLAGDIKRAYSQLAREWLAYARHLQEKYPYLYSLVARINPFGPSPSPIVRA